RKRAAITKYSLAGAALLGIGAAVTSAAWTDDAWFSANANAVDPATAINLQGAFNEDSWLTEPDAGDFVAADTSGVAVTIPAAVFADLTAGDSVTVPVWIKNAGSSDLVIAAPVVTPTGDLFAADGATATLGTAPTALDSGDVTSVDLTIALPDTADAATFGGATGNVTIQFQGSIANR
ncbi:hypothetical protein, partial [Cellulomonas sp.]|uniref:hypothetical protein n=1 Tax=Cellulomonas sp. TaxID=40001 RepID=UPI001B034744